MYCLLLWIRLKLSGNEMTPDGSPSIGATPNATPRNDEKAAAIAALTDLMEELEELSVRTVYFITYYDCLLCLFLSFNIIRFQVVKI